jgi:tight adherence protein C
MSTTLGFSLLVFGVATLVFQNDYKKSHRMRHRLQNLFYIQTSQSISNLLNQFQKSEKGSKRIVLMLQALEPGSIKKFKKQQFWYATCGVLGSTTFLLSRINTLEVLHLIITLAAIPLTGYLGWQIPISNLKNKMSKHQLGVTLTFSQVVDLISLSVSAGNSLASSLGLVSKLVDSPWDRQLDLCMQDLESGLSLVSALEGLAQRNNHPVVDKFVNAIALTLERGTPLSDLLRIQAAEVSEKLHRQLLTAAARKEVSMLIPVVFLVLPTIVIAALFPGISALGNLM